MIVLKQTFVAGPALGGRTLGVTGFRIVPHLSPRLSSPKP